MSDEVKVLEAIQKASDKLDSFEKSSKAEIKAVDGVATVKGELEAFRKQHQELAETVKLVKNMPADGREICRELGKIIVKAASEGTDAAGGHTVNDELRTTILSVQNQYGVIRQIFGSNIVPMASDVCKIPVDTFEESGTVPVPAATSENAQISASDDADLDQVTLTAAKKATLSYISNELVQDSFVDFVGAYLLPKIARQASKLEDQIVLTTASTGLLNTSNVQIVTMGAGRTSFNNIDFDDLLDMEDKLVDDALQDAMFLGNRTVWNLLRKLKGLDGQYLAAPASAGEPMTVRGYPYMRASVMPSKTDSAVSTGFLIFGDLTKGCVVGERGERKISVSDDFRFDYDQKAVRMTFRFAFNTNANIGRAISVLKTAAV